MTRTAAQLEVENRELRNYLIHVCREACSPSWRGGQREFWAIQDAANDLREPFSWEKVQAIYEALLPVDVRLAKLAREVIAIARAQGSLHPEEADRIDAIELELKTHVKEE